MSSVPPIVAAGALCWRESGGTPKVLVVRRDTHGDISLPKGKLDPGETAPQAAVREIFEETGLSIVLGASFEPARYRLPNGRRKIVHYWSAEVGDHALEVARFTPNDEIAGLEWLPLPKAMKKLSYEHDRELVAEFAQRYESGRARTFAIALARHGKAVDRSSWDGPDATRPLLHRGMDQASGIAAGLAAYRPERIISSTAVRCVSTLEPLSAASGLPIKATEAISQDAWESGQGKVPEVIARRLKKRVSAVLCSHGPVLPQLVAELAAATSTIPDAALRESASLATGAFSVYHVARDSPESGLVAVETHAAPL